METGEPKVVLQEQKAVLQEFIDKWLARQPRQRVALAFVDGRRYPGHVALAAFEQEMLGSAYGIREPSVALAKLNWWAEELADAAETGGRHPLTQVLFDEERAHELSGALWLGPVTAAVKQLEQGTAPDFEAQIAAAVPLHGALATLETAWWYGPGAVSKRAVRFAVLNHLLYALGRLEADVERDRLPLPMAQLARHGLGREDLLCASPARQAAVRGQLLDWLAEWERAAAMPGPLSVFRDLASRHALELARAAVRAPDALAVLAVAAPEPRLATAWRAWRAARAWHRLAA